VGNVDGVVLRGSAGRRRERVIQRPGIVGHSLPRLLASSVRFSPGDVLVLATDGIDPGFAAGLDAGDERLDDAARLVELFATGLDDALILVARHRGADA
jgi:hypothetical protein